MTSAQPRMSAAAYRKSPGRPRERAGHTAILRWVRANVSSVVFHARNESPGRGRIGGARDKALGVTAGVSDLIGLVEAGPLAGRLFAIEVKRPGVVASEIKLEQIQFGRQVQERGGLFVLATSVEEVEGWAHAAGIVRPRGWVAPWATDPQWGAL